MKGRPAHVEMDRFGLKVECPYHAPPETADYPRETGYPLGDWYLDRQQFFDQHRDCKKLPNVH